ncbi:MAG: PTS sugar transporter subunit IIA [Anaerolineaceae bacterium]|jgi:mannitol/fructose-specific phosphotransferase system IIA component (Ntr-type)|nr:PTS sugar transporter subunit IIA [Anaerolineaceae bacterium]MDD4042603.1 PTS sugar transporter subunit IIA [Anaerolineaceae bacterium]MDD4577212.1 PTS sugar transporter subunit IIA [Anaerolineaceae bacterium]
MLLTELLRPNLIAVNVHVKDWEEAVREAGRLLVEDEAVEPRFVDAMIEVVKEFGPYIVLAPGFAMPHAKAEAGCLKSSLSLITLAEPVNFGNPENDPVHVVAALTAKDHGSHIEALSQLADVLANDSVVGEWAAAKSVDEILEIVEKYS